jgi:hypothetical protein
MPSRETFSIISLTLAMISIYVFVASSLLLLFIYMIDTFTGNKIMMYFVHDLFSLMVFSGVAMMIFSLPLLTDRK